MRYFIISANPEVYNHEEAFNRREYIDWYDSIKNPYNIGDIVYIYLTSTRQITYKTKVTKININNNTIVDDRDLWTDKNNYKSKEKYARLVLQLKLDRKELHLQKLREFGFRPPQSGKFNITNDKLKEYLEKFFNDDEKNKIRKLDEMVYPEIINDEKYYEGIGKEVIVNRYERNKNAREKCVRLKGSNCIICGFNFEEVYGAIGKNYIHVHHIMPISEINKKYQIDPEKDLVPICPNCHAMIHIKGNNEVYSVDELKEIINKKK